MLNNFKVLLGLLILIAGFAYYVTQSDQDTVSLPKHLMPDWQKDTQQMSKIDLVELSQGGESIVLQQNNDSWHVNDGFYANLAPLSELFQTLKETEYVEAKTKNPDNFDQLELSDDDLRVSLYQGEQLIDAIHIGKRANAGNVFIRRVDEQQTYLVKGLTPPTFNLNNWLLSTIIDVPEAEVNSVTFAPVEQPSFTVQRNGENSTLEIQNLPNTHQLKTTAQLDNLASGLSRLMIDEALPRDLTDKTLQSTVTYYLSDGSEIKLQLYQQDEQYYLTLSGEKVARYDDWMMKIAAYKFEALDKKRDDLIEPKPELDQTTE